MSLQSKWFIGKPDKQEWEKYVRNSRLLLEQLTMILEKEIESLEMPLDFDSASWAYQMADRQGQLKAYRNMLKLTNLKDMTNDRD